MTSPLSAAFQAEATRVRGKSNIGAAMSSTPNRQTINEIRQRERQEMDVVRGQVSLSEEGKRQYIARIWSNVGTEITRLTQADEAEHRRRYDELERSVFGILGSTANDAISFRDATEKARTFADQAEALDALGSATISGDTVYAKAILLRAWTKGWTAVTDVYVESNPSVADKLSELKAIASWRDSASSRLGGNIVAGHPKPTELAGLSASQIDKLARTDMPAAQPGSPDYWKQNNVYDSAGMARTYGQGRV